jgi:hypothetical protein
VDGEVTCFSEDGRWSYLLFSLTQACILATPPWGYFMQEAPRSYMTSLRELDRNCSARSIPTTDLSHLRLRRSSFSRKLLYSLNSFRMRVGAQSLYPNRITTEVKLYKEELATEVVHQSTISLILISPSLNNLTFSLSSTLIITKCSPLLLPFSPS